MKELSAFNPLNTELNPIFYLLALLGAHHILHVSKIRVKCINLLKCCDIGSQMTHFGLPSVNNGKLE
jgi:hypothetical protein